MAGFVGGGSFVRGGGFYRFRVGARNDCRPVTPRLFPGIYLLLGPSTGSGTGLDASLRLHCGFRRGLVQDSRVKPGNDTVAKPEMTQCSPLPWTLSKYRHCSVHTAPSTGSGSGWAWDDGRLFGLLLFRLETVQLDALLFQLPPRLTRLEPDAAPVPNVFCWALPYYFAEKFCSYAPFFRAPWGAPCTERKFLLFRPGTDNAKTEAADAVVVAVVRVVVAPVGDSAAGRKVDPAATA